MHDKCGMRLNFASYSFKTNYYAKDNFTMFCNLHCNCNNDWLHKSLLKGIKRDNSNFIEKNISWHGEQCKCSTFSINRGIL